MLDDVEKILVKEQNLLKIYGDDIIVVGDLHGNGHSFRKIMKRAPFIQGRKYVFLGDYVDRGDESVEIVNEIFRMKLERPGDVILLRGNHESYNIAQAYGFKAECNEKKVSFEDYIRVLEKLPLICIINDYFICLHGGISPKLDLTTFNSFNRFPYPVGVDRPDNFYEVVEDILWSDPTDTPSIKYEENNERRMGLIYSQVQTLKFLKENKLKVILRAHEPAYDGVKVGKGYTTVFSSANYCNTNNYGGIVFISQDNSTKLYVYDDTDNV